MGSSFSRLADLLRSKMLETLPQARDIYVSSVIYPEDTLVVEEAYSEMIRQVEGLPYTTPEQHRSLSTLSDTWLKKMKGGFKEGTEERVAKIYEEAFSTLQQEFLDKQKC